MSIPILRIRGADGAMHPVAALRGDRGEKGDKGDPYTLTPEDRDTIVQAVLSALPSAEEVAY